MMTEESKVKEKKVAPQALLDSVRKKHNRLTPEQEKFAQFIVTKEGRWTNQKCALEAGYSKASAHISASKLLNPKYYPAVVARIQELREQYNQKYAVDYGRHIRKLAEIRDMSIKNKAWTAAVNAEIARGKAAGLYVDKKEILHGKIDSMSKEEVENRLKKIIEDYAPLLDNVTYEDIKLSEEQDNSGVDLPIDLKKVSEPVNDLIEEEEDNYEDADEE